MPDPAQCYRCGTTLDDSAQSDICPACLRQLAQANWLAADSGVETSRAPGEAPCRLGDYELLQEVARGGMGVVYRARQVSLDREVALKTIQAGAMASAEAAQRFHIEAHAAAKLDHPNIVPIYDSGEVAGHYFYTMKLVRGRSLAAELAREYLGGELMEARTTRRAAQLVAEVARAIHYAHQRGVLHRDLKPANILLDAEGRPHVTDFGLAKLLGIDSKVTLTEAVIGSPAYMAPEQATGRSRESTIATDIYSLGAILYELLAAQPPFRGAHLIDTLRQVTENEPKRPSLLRRNVDLDLETICLKCLEKEPQRRYSSAQALAEDLDRWLRNEPILARPISTISCLHKWMRRKPAVAALALALSVVSAAGVAGIVWHWRQALHHQRVAEANLYAADMVLAGLAVQENDLGKARPLLDRHRSRRNSQDLRGWEWRYLAGLCAGDELFTLRAAQQPVSMAFLSRDRLAVASRDGQLQIWDPITRRILRKKQISGSLYLEDASPDGRWVATSDENTKTVLFWATESLDVVHAVPAALDTCPNHLVAFTPGTESAFVVQERVKQTGQHLIVHVPLVRREQTPEPVWEGENISDIACAADGSRLGICAAERAILLNFETGSRTIIADGNGNPVPARRLAFAPYNLRLVLTADDALHIVDTSTARLIESKPLPIEGAGNAQFTPDGKFLFGTVYQQVWLQEIEPWRIAGVFRGHVESIIKETASPDGRWLATGSRDGAIKFWSIRSEPDDIVAQVFNETGRLRFDETGRRLVTILWKTNLNEVVVRDTGNWSIGARLPIPGDEVLDAVLLGEGDALAVARSDERVELWDMAAQKLVRPLLKAADQQFDRYRLAFQWLRSFENGSRLACLQEPFGTIPWVDSQKRHRVFLRWEPPACEPLARVQFRSDQC